ncbi:MAG: hypothetical protein Q9217_000141 [Psora testacea]
MTSVLSNIYSTASHQTTFRVAIIGGGIGGLSLALGLNKYPHIDYHIYEAAPSFGEIGAGVSFGPNAQRALELIGGGAKEAFLKHATTNMWSSHVNTWAEYIVGKGPNAGEKIGVQRNATGQQSVHRAKFLDELVQGVPAQRSHFDKRLVSLEDTSDGPVIMHFKDGTEATADAVIGADGIHSVVRTYVLGGEAAKPVYTGCAVYRKLISMDAAIEKLGAEYAQNCHFICGPDTEDLSVWALNDMPPAPVFASNCVCMLGDAAHATTPFQGSGAGQAIEDALVLSVLLAKVTDKIQLPNAFSAYDQVRRPRSQKVVTTSRQAGNLIAMKLDGVGPDKEKMRANLKTRMHWIWGRDLGSQNREAVKLFEENYVSSHRTRPVLTRSAQKLTPITLYKHKKYTHIGMALAKFMDVESHSIEQWVDFSGENVDHGGTRIRQRLLDHAQGPNVQGTKVTSISPPQETVSSKKILGTGDSKDISSRTINPYPQESTTTIPSPPSSAVPASKKGQAYVPPQKRAAASSTAILKSDSVDNSDKKQSVVSPNNPMSASGPKEGWSPAENKPLTGRATRTPSKQKRTSKPKHSKTVKPRKTALWFSGEKKRALDQPWR